MFSRQTGEDGSKTTVPGVVTVLDPVRFFIVASGGCIVKCLSFAAQLAVDMNAVLDVWQFTTEDHGHCFC